MPNDPNDPSSGDTSYGPHNGLMITHEKLEDLGPQGAGSSIPMVNAVSADSVSPDKGHRNATTIDILLDNILLEMFDHCRKRDDQYYRFPYCVWEWHLIVHVC